MGFDVRQRPSSSDGGNFVSYCRIAPQFATKNVFAQLFQAAEIVMFHVPVGLVQFCRDFRQRVPLNEEQAQGLALVVREAVENLLHAGIPQQRMIVMVLPTNAVPAVAHFVFYLRKIHTRVEMARIKVTPPTEGAMIRHLKNPESG